MLRQIDPLHLEKLVSFRLDVADAEEDGVAAHIGDKPSHLLMALKFVDSVASSDLTTVRINFNSLHLAHVISAFSSARTILTDEDETDLANSNVFSKVGRLVAITTDQMSVPMQFLNDLDLTSSAFLTKHYKVTHTLSSKNENQGNFYVHYLIKKRNQRNQRDKDWALSLKVTQQITFDFKEDN